MEPERVINHAAQRTRKAGMGWCVLVAALSGVEAGAQDDAAERSCARTADAGTLQDAAGAIELATGGQPAAAAPAATAPLVARRATVPASANRARGDSSELMAASGGAGASVPRPVAQPTRRLAANPTVVDGRIVQVVVDDKLKKHIDPQLAEVISGKLAPAVVAIGGIKGPQGESVLGGAGWTGSGFVVAVGESLKKSWEGAYQGDPTCPKPSYVLTTRHEVSPLMVRDENGVSKMAVDYSKYPKGYQVQVRSQGRSYEGVVLRCATGAEDKDIHYLGTDDFCVVKVKANLGPGLNMKIATGQELERGSNGKPVQLVSAGFGDNYNSNYARDSRVMSAIPGCQIGPQPDEALRSGTVTENCSIPAGFSGDPLVVLSQASDGGVELSAVGMWVAGKTPQQSPESSVAAGGARVAQQDKLFPPGGLSPGIYIPMGKQYDDDSRGGMVTDIEGIISQDLGDTGATSCH